MRNSNTARRLVGTVAAAAVSLTACIVVMLAPTSADAINSLRKGRGGGGTIVATQTYLSPVNTVNSL